MCYVNWLSLSMQHQEMDAYPKIHKGQLAFIFIYVCTQVNQSVLGSVVSSHFLQHPN